MHGHDGPASVHVIHQDLGLIPYLNTVDNLDLGRSHGARVAPPTRPRAEAQHARELLSQFDATFDVTVPVAQLTPAERTMVAIARARPDGRTIAYLQCSTPACAFFAQILAPTQKALGYELKVDPEQHGFDPDFAERFTKLWGAGA